MARTIVIDKDLGWKNIQKELKRLNQTVSKVGFFGQGESPKNNIAARAAIHEFGSKHTPPGIPKRPFMRNAFDKNSNKMYNFINQTYDLLKLKKITVNKFIRLISEWLIGKIQNEIRAGEFKPLKPQTIKRKESSVILIHKGQMINSPTYKVEKNV